MAIRTGNLGLAVEYGFDDLRPSWMENFVFDNDSDPWDTSLPLRGTYTDTQPITAQPANNHSGQRSLSFADDFYDHIIINPTVIDVGNVVSEQFYEISVFNGYQSNKTLLDLAVTNSDGFTVTGPAIASVWGPLQTRTYRFTITAEGPPSVNTDVRFDWENTQDDTTVTIRGSRIVMLPYQAQTPWTEVLEWKTNILTSNNGTEQRIRLRRAPRQRFHGSYPVPPEQLARAFNMAYGWIDRRWALGVWSETQYIGALASGSNLVSCNTTNYDFRANGLVCLWESNERNELIEIDTVESSSLVFKRALAGDYTNAILIPVRTGMVDSGSIQRVSNGYSSVLDIEYAVTDNVVISSTAPTQYLNYDIYYNETLMGDENGLSDNIKIRLDQVDYESGIVDYFAPWTTPKRTREVMFLNNGASECYTFKRWLFRRIGRLRPYWLPMFEDNLRLRQSGYIESMLICAGDDYRTLGSDHNHIAIQLNNGSWLPRTVLGTSVDGNNVNLALDVALNLEATEIKRICFLGLHRLDTDRVEINWIGNFVNQCSLRIIEIKP